MSEEASLQGSQAASANATEGLANADEPVLLRNMPDYLERLNNFDKGSMNEQQKGIYQMIYGSPTWYQLTQYSPQEQAMLIVVALACLYSLTRILRFIRRDTKAATPENSEISLINNLYRGLNKEETKLQASIEKHVKWQMRLKYAQTCLYVFIACIAFWCYKAPAFRTAGTTTYVVIAAPIVLVYAFQLLIYVEQGKVKEREK